MKNASVPKTILSQATPVLGAVALSAIALVGMAQSSQAADCSLEKDGVNWVSECKPGIDRFANSWVNIHLSWNIPELQRLLGEVPEDFSIHDWIMFSGPVKVERGAGNNGVIETNLYHQLTGKHRLFGELTLLTKGIGKIEDAGNGLANSFFNVDFTLFGGLFGGRTRIYADRPLLGVPPDILSHAPINKPCPSSINSDVSVIYCGGKTDLFYVGEDGEFGTEDDTVVAQIHSEEHIVHPRVPEPSTAAASIFVGVAAMFGLKRKQQSNK